MLKNLKRRTKKFRKALPEAANKAEIISTTLLDLSICAKYGRHVHLQMSHADGSFLHEQKNHHKKEEKKKQKNSRSINLN